MPKPSIQGTIDRLRPSLALRVERLKLPNGLTLLCAPEPGSGLVSVQFWVRTGSIHEGALLGSGVSHYLEHLVFKGTANHAGREISPLVQSHGGSMNAYTTFDRTVYYIDLPAEHVAFALRILSELVFRPTLPPEEVEREREVILREIDMTLDEPDTLLWQAVFETAYREHPYRHPVIGHRELFRSVTRADLEAYWKNRYEPGNVTVVVAGDVDPAEVAGALEGTAGSVARRGVAPVLVPSEPAQVGERLLSRLAKVQLTRGGIAYKIPGLGHPDAAAIDVLASVLGAGNSSILWKEAREKRRLVHEIQASAWNPGDGGLLFVAYSADPKRSASVVPAVREIMEGSGSRRFSQADIDKIIRMVLVQEVQSRRTVSGLASRIGSAAVVVGDLNFFDTYLNNLAAVDPAALRRVAASYLRGDGLTAVTLDPEESAPRAAARRVQAACGNWKSFEVGGVPVLLQEDSRLPMVNVRAVLAAGPSYEKPALYGVSSLLATLLARDTRKRTAAQVDEMIESTGGSFGSFSGNNSLGVCAEVLPDDLALGMDLLTEGLAFPKFMARTLAVEKEGQIAGLRDVEDDVVSQGRRILREEIFGSHPLAVSPYGLLSTVPKLTVAHVSAHHEAIVRRGNLVLCVAGAIEERKIRPWIERLVARIPEGKVRLRTPGLDPRPAAARTEHVPRGQAVVYLGFPGPGLRDPDTYAAEVANELFSGMSSRLFERVREERGLCYFIRAGRVLGVGAGAFFFESGTAPGKHPDVLEEIRLELKRVRSGGVTAEEVERCHRRLVVARRMQLQTLGARTMQTGLCRLLDLSSDDPETYERSIRAVGARELAAFAERWLDEAFCRELVMLGGEN